jgi:hypothetical protein
MTQVETLAIHGEEICSKDADVHRLESLFGTPGLQLATLLSPKNGYYAFENALHVFPECSTETEIGIVEWNAQDLWRKEYGDAVADAVFFAEDVFGMQFCLREGQVARFDPETAEFEHIAADLVGWVALILGDSDYWTGCPVLREWQSKNGPLMPGFRLCPTIPFVLGGEFAASNLYSVDAVLGMQYRASVACQLRDVPDGATIKLQVADSVGGVEGE